MFEEMFRNVEESLTSFLNSVKSFSNMQVKLGSYDTLAQILSSCSELGTNNQHQDQNLLTIFLFFRSVRSYWSYVPLSMCVAGVFNILQ